MIRPSEKLLTAFSQRKESTIREFIKTRNKAGLTCLASKIEKKFCQTIHVKWKGRRNSCNYSGVVNSHKIKKEINKL